MRAAWRLAAPLAFAAAGVLFVTSAGAAQGGDLRGGTRSDLTDLIRAEERRADDAAARVDRLRAEVETATARAGLSDRQVAAAARRAAELAPAAGIEAVSGPGLRVTLTDAPRSADRVLPEDAKPDDLVVHEQDVHAVMNALWAGGGEAMQVMDQRIITTSAVRCVGNTLILGGRVYSPPFEITAIGDPDRLRAALDVSEGVLVFRYYVEQYGLGYATEDLADTTLPAYEGSLDLAYARPAP